MSSLTLFRLLSLGVLVLGLVALVLMLIVARQNGRLLRDLRDHSAELLQLGRTDPGGGPLPAELGAASALPPLPRSQPEAPALDSDGWLLYQMNMTAQALPADQVAFLDQGEVTGRHHLPMPMGNLPEPDQHVVSEPQVVSEKQYGFLGNDDDLTLTPDQLAGREPFYRFPPGRGIYAAQEPTDPPPETDNSTTWMWEQR